MVLPVEGPAFEPPEEASSWALTHNVSGTDVKCRVAREIRVLK